MRILVFGGGLYHERYVSLASASHVARVLRGRGHEVTQVDLDTSSHALMEDEEFDAIVNLLHGRDGEDGSFQSALELRGSTLVGSGSEAARRAFDKAISPSVLRDARLGVPRYRVVTRELVRELGSSWYVDYLLSDLGGRVVVKPRFGGSALGVTIASDTTSLAHGLGTAFRYDEVAIVQEFVSGVEVSICLIESGEGLIALPAVKVGLEAGEWYDFEHRTSATSMRLIYGDEIEGIDKSRCQRDALSAAAAFGMRGFSRVDMIVPDDGVPRILEVAVTPGMTENSLFPKVVAAAGLDFGAVWSSLVELAVMAGSGGNGSVLGVDPE